MRHLNSEAYGRARGLLSLPITRMVGAKAERGDALHGAPTFSPAIDRNIID